MRVEAEARVGGSGGGSGGGASLSSAVLSSSSSMTEKESDRLSVVMLERDRLLHDNEQMKREFELLSTERVGAESALSVARQSRDQMIERLHVAETK